MLKFNVCKKDTQQQIDMQNLSS